MRSACGAVLFPPGLTAVYLQLHHAVAERVHTVVSGRKLEHSDGSRASMVSVQVHGGVEGASASMGKDRLRHVSSCVDAQFYRINTPSPARNEARESCCDEEEDESTLGGAIGFSGVLHGW